VDPEFDRLIHRLPTPSSPPLPPEWLESEMRERRAVLSEAALLPGSVVLEVGAGGHALTTVPLAYALGPEGSVIAVERERWGHFRPIVAASGLGGRIRAIGADARRLPLRDDGADLAVCVHGLRSLRGEEYLVSVFREMLRVAPRLFVAESLPVARTEAQRAHLAMYELREELFEATTGRKDDLRYLPLKQVAELVARAGGVVTSSRTLEVESPHALAFFPRAMIEGLSPGPRRASLLERWDRAAELGRRHGTNHPPVGTVAAAR
jgi:ubiquinone/menaquinone biosynthesis C-methylase UbiE